MMHECTQCGLCCHKLSATFTLEDVNREPRLLDVALPMNRVGNKRTFSYMKEKGHPWVINKNKRGDPCSFLDVNNLCLIHATRPQICRDYPHGHKCMRELENGNT